MKLAHGLYFSRRRYAIYAVFNGEAVSWVDVRYFAIGVKSGFEEVVRSNITSDLIMAGLHEADATSIAYSKVKFLPKIAL